MTQNSDFNILFLCTGNSARSLIAEGVMRHLAQGRIGAFSAGSFPTGTPNQFALDVLSHHQIDIGFARSKKWDEFAVPTGPVMDVIITVCDNAAGESCPVWPGHPAQSHWGVADPAAISGNNEKKRAAFERCYKQIYDRISLFLSAHPHKLNAGLLADHVSRQFPSEPSLSE